MTVRRNWIVAMTAFACAALLAANGLTAEEPKKVPKDAIKEMMIAAHRGEMSSLKRTEAELKKDTPDWDQLAKDAKEFAAMADMLKGAGLYTDSSKYISSAGALSKAIGDKDSKAATEAFTGLGKSCSACHYNVRK